MLRKLENGSRRPGAQNNELNSSYPLICGMYYHLTLFEDLEESTKLYRREECGPESCSHIDEKGRTRPLVLDQLLPCPCRRITFLQNLSSCMHGSASKNHDVSEILCISAVI